MKKIAVLFTLIILCFASNAYAKEIANGECKINLSDEEQEALKQAVAK